MAERAATWLLRSRRPPLDIADTIETFAPAFERLSEGLDDLTFGEVRIRIDELRERRVTAGVPIALAARAARWPWLHTGFDMVEVARRRGCPIDDVARSYWQVFEEFELAWLWDGIGLLPRSNRWQTQARASLRDDLMTVLAMLTSDVIATADGDPTAWIALNERAVARAISIHTEIRRAEGFDLTTLSVALRQLRNLTLTTASDAVR
jgi:glutamate dehydrogenase